VGSFIQFVAVCTARWISSTIWTYVTMLGPGMIAHILQRDICVHIRSDLINVCFADEVAQHASEVIAHVKHSKSRALLACRQYPLCFVQHPKSDKDVHVLHPFIGHRPCGRAPYLLVACHPFSLTICPMWTCVSMASQDGCARCAHRGFLRLEDCFVKTRP